MRDENTMTGRYLAFREKLQPGLDSAGSVLGGIGHGIKLVITYLFRMQKLLLSAPVLFAAVYLAQYNMNHLPEQVGLDLQTTGEYAIMISRNTAVMGPGRICHYDLPEHRRHGSPGVDGAVPGADVLFPADHVSLDHQPVLPGPSGPAAAYESVSRVKKFSRKSLAFPGDFFAALATSKNRQAPKGACRFLVDLKGFEPSTPTMRMWCAPNCATSPFTRPFAA